MLSRRTLSLGCAFALSAAAASARQVESHVVVPQSRAFVLDRAARPIEITGVRARIRILEQTATTDLEIALRNASDRPAEAVLLLPVPDGAAVGAFSFDGPAVEPTARLLRADEARRTYDDIVRRTRDPALLEFAGFALVRTSVFPVPARGTQLLRLTYEHILESDGNRIDYILPRSESLEVRTPWSIEADVRQKSAIASVYSPSHAVSIERQGANRLIVRLSPGAETQTGAFRLSLLIERGEVSASLIAYPDPKIGGGYFLLLAGVPPLRESDRRAIRREVTIVLDRSGSMAGQKLEQARTAAIQVIEGLEDGESFNIIDYSTQVSLFAGRPLEKTRPSANSARRYLNTLRPGGGTAIHDALVEALRQEPTPGALPIVLFLTDGLPTVGPTSESVIRDLVEKGNPQRRRIFAFGVGTDVNVPLLDRIADLTRASATYVLPGEDTELKVDRVFRHLRGPALADVKLEALDGDGLASTRIVRDLLPGRIPDLFDGEPLIVLGRYVGEGDLRFRLSGNLLGTSRVMSFHFGLGSATTRNSFVPRLWATRQIALLADQVRQAGLPISDPRMRELADEIVRLSAEFGVLTEYTSFLATEGTRLEDWGRLVAACTAELDARAVKSRSGEGALSQGENFNERKSQSVLNPSNSQRNDKLERVETTAVQQVCDRAFFKQGARWIDGRLIAGKQSLEPQQIVELGSVEHGRIVDALVAEGRQGLLCLRGELLLPIDGKNVLIRN